LAGLAPRPVMLGRNGGSVTGRCAVIVDWRPDCLIREQVNRRRPRNRAGCEDKGPPRYPGQCHRRHGCPRPSLTRRGGRGSRDVFLRGRPLPVSRRPRSSRNIRHFRNGSTIRGRTAGVHPTRRVWVCVSFVSIIMATHQNRHPASSGPPPRRARAIFFSGVASRSFWRLDLIAGPSASTSGPAQPVGGPGAL